MGYTAPNLTDHLVACCELKYHMVTRASDSGCVRKRQMDSLEVVDERLTGLFEEVVKPVGGDPS